MWVLILPKNRYKLIRGELIFEKTGNKRQNFENLRPLIGPARKYGPGLNKKDVKFPYYGGS